MVKLIQQLRTADRATIKALKTAAETLHDNSNAGRVPVIEVRDTLVDRFGRLDPEEMAKLRRSQPILPDSSVAF